MQDQNDTLQECYYEGLDLGGRGGGGTYVSCQLNFFYFISFALKTRRKFNSLSSVRSTGLRTRACAFNLQIPYPRSNSGKCTFAYSAATLFNCLDTDLKQIACVSPSCIIYIHLD